MKKGTIVAIVVAIVLIIVGGILLAMGLSFAGGEKSESTLVQQETMIQESFENIQIDTQDCDVTFVPYNGTADAHVVILERENTHHDVWVEDNTLKIKMVERDWTDYIGIYRESMEITVYLPQKQYTSVWVTTDTGEIRTPVPLAALEIQLRSSTGMICCDGVAGDLLDCMTSTGDIHVRDCAPVTLKVQSDTGDVYLSNVESTDMHLQTDTGDKEVRNVACERLTCDSSTGDVELHQVMAEEYLQVFTTTGEVEIENSDAGNVNIETDTGDIQLPAAWKTKDVRIDTDTGDIHFK